MSSGVGVIEYQGARGIVYRIKYRDAEGRQVMETLGSAADGWTRKKAEAERRERLVRVERKNYRRPRTITFGDYRRTWFEEASARRAWKPGSVASFRGALNRLGETFDGMPLAAIRPRHIAEYVRAQAKQYAPKTINLDLNVLHDLLKTAMREELIDSNAAELVERPKVGRRRWRLLEPSEIPIVERSFTDDLARLMFRTLVLTGVRRFELQNLLWRDVDLVDMVIRITDSKSEEGIRSIALPDSLAEALWQHRRKSAYKGDDDRVFCHPKRGSKFDHEWYAEKFREALDAAGITDYVRPFHDIRHTALTNYAAATGNPVALMATAGHRSFSTTKTYMHLAGVTFKAEGATLEQRLYGGRKFYPTEQTSDDLAAPNAALEADSEAA